MKQWELHMQFKTKKKRFLEEITQYSNAFNQKTSCKTPQTTKFMRVFEIRLKLKKGHKKRIPKRANSDQKTISAP